MVCTWSLHLGVNQIGAEGAGRVAGVLPQSPALSILFLEDNEIGDEGARRLAGVLPQCPALRYLRLGGNQIGAEVAGGLRAAWRWPQCGLLLEKKM